jgi:hypothetical protein
MNKAVIALQDDKIEEGETRNVWQRYQTLLMRGGGANYESLIWRRALEEQLQTLIKPPPHDVDSQQS